MFIGHVSENTITQHMHATYVNSDFVPCEILQNFTATCSTPAHTFGADKFESASRRKKVNCLNVKKFFQLCVSILEMISILVDSFSILVIGCHPNFEPIEFKLAYVKRKLMLIN